MIIELAFGSSAQPPPDLLQGGGHPCTALAYLIITITTLSSFSQILILIQTSI